MSQGRLPPRQRPPAVQRVSKALIVGLGTIAVVVLITMFVRGTAPRRPTVQTGTTDHGASTRPVVADGWLSGLPDEPPPSEPPRKPEPPVDEAARQQLQQLRQLILSRDEQWQKTFEEFRKLLSQRPAAEPPRPAQTSQPPKPDPVAEMRQKAMASRMQMVTVDAPADAPSEGPGMRLITAGTYIPISLETAINSDREGEVEARVTTRILDAHGREVIPQQAKLLGRYRAQTLYGDERIDLWFDKLNLGTGDETITIDEQTAADSIGQAGATGDVDNKYGLLLKAVLINSVLQAGAVEVQQNITELDGVGAFAGSLAQNAAQVGQRRNGRSLNTNPTIRVARGARMTLILNRDLWITTPKEGRG